MVRHSGSGQASAPAGKTEPGIGPGPTLPRPCCPLMTLPRSGRRRMSPVGVSGHIRPGVSTERATWSRLPWVAMFSGRSCPRAASRASGACTRLRTPTARSPYRTSAYRSRSAERTSGAGRAHRWASAEGYSPRSGRARSCRRRRTRAEKTQAGSSRTPRAWSARGATRLESSRPYDSARGRIRCHGIHGGRRNAATRRTDRSMPTVCRRRVGYARAAIASARRGNLGLKPRSSRRRRPSMSASKARARSAFEPSGGGAPTDANSVARSGASSSTTL